MKSRVLAAMMATVLLLGLPGAAMVDEGEVSLSIVQ